MTKIVYVPADQLVVASRQRQIFARDSISNLSLDIAESGLMNPCTIYQADGEFRLIAGERRLRAMRDLHENQVEFSCGSTLVPHNHIPCLIFEGLDETKAYEMELNENILREDLTWTEKTEAIANLHKLRKAQNPTQTFTETAEELAKASGKTEKATRNDQANVRKAALIAEFLDVPEVRKAPNVKAAYKVVTGLMEKQFADAYAPAVNPSVSPHTLYEGDMKEIGDLLESEKYALLLTDPPYGMGVKDFGDAAKFSHNYSEEGTEQLHKDLVLLASRVCQSRAHAFVFCNLAFFPTLVGYFQEAGWRVRKTPLIWSKGNAGHLADGDVLGFRRSYECILSATRGSRPYNRLSNDVLVSTMSEQRIHAAQKPTDLYRELIELATDYDEHVLDPFAGSGTIFEACAKAGRCATGIELDPESVSLIETYRDVHRA